nr:unnamed protein product [Callosobruchus chinensis]
MALQAVYLDMAPYLLYMLS